MKVLMVCLGNICRSPLAEGILKNKINLKGLSIKVDSAGTAAYHVGEEPDVRAQEIAKKNGIDLSYQRARQFQVEDFEDFDKIFVMDRTNYGDVAALARNENDLKKVDLILNTIYPGEDRQVPDPYYGGEDGFKNVFNMLDKSCDVILKDLNH